MGRDIDGGWEGGWCCFGVLEFWSPEFGIRLWISLRTLLRSLLDVWLSEILQRLRVNDRDHNAVRIPRI